MTVSKKELSDAVRQARELDRLTDRLSLIAMEIARGYLRSDKFKGYSEADREDIVGMFLIQLVRSWRRLDPEQNCHAYLTRSVTFAWMTFQRGNSRRIRRESVNAERLIHDREQEMVQIMKNLRGVDTVGDHD